MSGEEVETSGVQHFFVGKLSDMWVRDELFISACFPIR